ncbi:PKD domain-containing protein [Candidatus Woesearchaeota archaeon]|nr:PKD domain-containing protein [Candidatus Woesearchaeota archaeon]
MPSVKAASCFSEDSCYDGCSGYSLNDCYFDADHDCQIGSSDNCKDCSCSCGGYPNTGSCATEDVVFGPTYYSCGDSFDNDGDGDEDCADDDCTDKECGGGNVCFEGSCVGGLGLVCTWYNGVTPLADCNGVNWCNTTYTLTDPFQFMFPFFNTTPSAPVPSCIISASGRADNLQGIYMNVTLSGDCTGDNCPTEGDLTEPWWEPFPPSLTARTHTYDLSDEDGVPEHTKPFDCSLPASVNVTEQPGYFTNPNCCGDGTNVSDALADQGMIANISNIPISLCVRQDVDQNALQDQDTYVGGTGCPYPLGRNPGIETQGPWLWEQASALQNLWKIYTINLNESCWQIPKPQGAFDRPVYDVIGWGATNNPQWIACDPFGAFNLSKSQREGQAPGLDLGNANSGITVTPPPDLPESGGGNGGVVPDAGFFEDLGIHIQFPKKTYDEDKSAWISCLPDAGSGRNLTRIVCEGSGFEGDAIQANSSFFTHNETSQGTGTFHRDELLNNKEFSNLPIYFNGDLQKGYHNLTLQTNGTNSRAYVFASQYLVLSDTTEDEPVGSDTDRVICYDEGNRGSWAVCCGYSYADCPTENNGLWDVNANPNPKVKRSGEVLGSVIDYYNSDDPSANYVLKLWIATARIDQESGFIYGLINDVAHSFNNNPNDDYMDAPLRITNWKNYSFLEFDIAFTTTDLWNITIFDSAAYPISDDILTQESQLNLLQFNISYPSKAPLFNRRIIDYSTDGNELYEWHHIKIPLPPSLKQEDISLIMFVGDREAIKNEVHYRWGKLDVFNIGGNTAAVFGLDRMYLSRDSMSYTNNTFCSGGGRWIDDLDESALACDNTAKTAWTGSQCCGDDPHEYYADPAGLHACWDGRIVPHDTRIMQVDYTVTGSSTESHACKGYNSFISATAEEDAEEFVNACLYPMPRTGRALYTVANPYTELYNVSFFAAENGAQYFSQATTDSALVAVHDVKMQVLANNGNLYGCNASDYVIDHAGSGVIRESIPCEVKGSWFCSGTNQWLNKSDSRYTLGETEVMNLTAIPWEIPWYDPTPRAECCGNNACWNGTTCQSEYTYFNQTTDEGNDIYVCKASQWYGPVPLKWDWDHDQASFCWNNTQCFCPYDDDKCDPVDDRNCVDENYFYRDNFCLSTGWNGTAYNDSVWTTRTALLATQLLTFVNRTSSDNYTLFCDYYNLSTNYWGETEIWNGPFLGLEGLNNYCVLNYETGEGWRVIVGASLWESEGYTVQNFLDEILQETPTICDNVGSTTFEECADGELIMAYWNNQTKSMLFAEEELHGFSLEPGDKLVLNGGNLLQNFNLFLQFVFAKIRNTATHLLGLQGEETQHLAVAEDFDRLYLFKENQKEIKGMVREDLDGKYLLVSYFNATTDICKAVQAYNILNQGMGGSPFACNVSVYEDDSWSYNVVTRRNSSPEEWSYLIGLNAWPSLGAMSRLDVADFGYVPTMASINAEIIEGQALLTSFEFEAVVAGTAPDSYLWDFGDASQGTGKTITHNYAIAGSYNVTLNASYDGRIIQDRIVVTVREPALDCTLRSTACNNEEVGVLSLLEQTNSHIFTYDPNSEYNICCTPPTCQLKVTTPPSTCGSLACITALTQMTGSGEGSHAALCDTADLDHVCMDVTNCGAYDLSCNQEDQSEEGWENWGACTTGSCVVTISSDGTHLSGCDYYPFPVSVCCGLNDDN